MLLSYVDDILIVSETEKDIEEVLSVIGKKIVLKKTGLVQSSKGGGGQLNFLGDRFSVSKVTRLSLLGCQRIISKPLLSLLV